MVCRVSQTLGLQIAPKHRSYLCALGPKASVIYILGAIGRKKLVLTCSFLKVTLTTIQAGCIPRDPSITSMPTLGPKVCKHYLLWAIWVPGVVFLGHMCRGHKEGSQEGCGKGRGTQNESKRSLAVLPKGSK